MTTTLWIDLETRSRCELKTAGLYNYAEHDSTQIMIASYAVDMGPVKRWERLTLAPLPDDLLNMLKDPKVEIRAHNAAFERLLIRHGWKIRIDPARVFCTMFQARSASLPGSLADVGRALTSKMQKDVRGFQLIQLLSKPREDGSFNEDPGLYREFAEYCDHDVVVMRHISLTLPSLDAFARRVYAANEIINDRGLPIDTELCELAIAYAEDAKAEAEARVKAATNGELVKARGEKLTDWVYENAPELREMMDIIRRRSKGDTGGGNALLQDSKNKALHDTGEEYESVTLDADTRAAVFAFAKKNPGTLSPDVMEVVAANDDAMSTSVFKFKRMRDMVSPDGRLRGAFVPAGAAGTGRFSSHSAQLHNFPRKCADDPEGLKRIMRRHGKLPGPVLEILKSLLRAAICPGPNKRIVRGDWNAIEARALPWLTARASAANYMDAFRDPNRDIYIEQGQACGFPDNRPVGKVVTLAFGYGGGVNALNVMAKAQDVTIEGDKQRLVDAWRRVNPWAPEWWRENERMARAALANGGVWHPAGRVAFSAADWGKDSEGNAQRTLLMLLPSGRVVYYPYARTDEGDTLTYLKASWKPKKGAEYWPRGKAWGGHIAENATQAICCDLLRHALVNAVEGGLPVIGHVHDEIILEAGRMNAATLAEDLKEEMLSAPDWAAGLPLAVETDVSARYRK